MKYLAELQLFLQSYYVRRIVCILHVTKNDQIPRRHFSLLSSMSALQLSHVNKEHNLKKITKVRRPKKMSLNKPKTVCVIVLGDIGRSPRMQYHVKSLIQHNYNIDLIGYIESAPLKEITQDPNTKIHNLTPFPDLNLPTGLKYVFKTFWQILSLLIALFSIRRPQFVLCQNPPAIPTLFVCYFYSLLVRSKFIIDWHNYTHTILALGSSPTSPIVRCAKWIERKFGQKSWANLCVTNAMKLDLRDNWDINATVLYDRPSPAFQPISVIKKHELFKKLSVDYSTFASHDTNDSSTIESTVFTQKLHNGDVILKPNRPALLISSTSWTPDEDFGILLRALEKYDETASSSSHYPNLLCVITGKGPQKEHYLQLIANKKWTKVSILTPWLETDDYPKLLASADLGVCLHWSSSGLDLPMKVVDMFGCGLPVCAINFKCLGELVQHEKNGFVFENEKELAEQLISWFHEYPKNISLVNIKEIFQQNIRQFQMLRWNENWNKNALPLFRTE